MAARATGTLGLLLHRDGPDAALEVFRPLMDSGLPAAAGFAAREVGLILRSRGDLAGAEAAFRQTVGCPTASVAVEAALNLGVLLDVRGEPAEALAVLWTAMERVLSPFDRLRVAVLGLAAELEKGPPADDMTTPELAALMSLDVAAADLDGLPDGALPQRYRYAASRLRLVSARAGSAPEHLAGRGG